jgi:hypothetical protein
VADPANRIANEVATRGRGLTLYVGRLEKLHTRRELSRVDLHRAYAGAYLFFYTYLERSLERLFLGIMMNRYDFHQPGIRSLVSVRSDVVARSILSGERSYADWIPYDLTRKRAKAFLSGGLPFTSLGKPDQRVFARLSLIRNAIAHESTHALKQFRAEFTDGKSLPPEQRTPAGYLRGQHAVGQTRLEYSFAEAVGVLGRLCT